MIPTWCWFQEELAGTEAELVRALRATGRRLALDACTNDVFMFGYRDGESGRILAASIANKL